MSEDSKAIRQVPMPLKLDSKKVKEMGGFPGSLTHIDSIMRYVAGCMLRERERVAEVLKKHGMSEALVADLLDESKDENVFRWRGPGTSLNAPLNSVSKDS